MNNQRWVLFWWLTKIYIKLKPIFFIWHLISSFYKGFESIAVAFISAKFISEVSKTILSHNNGQQPIKWLVAMAILAVINKAMLEIDTLARARFNQAMQMKMHGLFIEKTYSLSQQQFDNEAFQAKLSKAREGMFEIVWFFNDIFWLISSIFRFAGSLIAISINAIFIGIIIVLALIPVFIVDVKLNLRRMKDDELTDKYSRMVWRTRYMLEDPLRMPEIRVLNAYKGLLGVWKKNSDDMYNVEDATNKLALKWRLFTETLDSSVNFGANLWFLRLAIGGSIGFDKFLFLRGLLSETTSAGTNIVTTLESLHRRLLNFENLRVVLQTSPAIPNGNKQIETSLLKIKFDDVSFKYPGSDDFALQNVNFVIDPNIKLALVGENGAGKSTIIKLLLRQYLPTSGKITVNGVNIANIDSDNYYQAISTLFQDFNIFEHLTVAENIAIGSVDDVTEQNIIDAAKLAGAHDFISKLKNKYQQRLTGMFSDGSSLSGGQLQRLGIARTILRKSALLILDEPTSAIDAKAEFEIFNNIYSAHSGKATLIISHRFSTVRKADEILVLENGKIVERGSHQHLVTKDSSLYKEMFELQAEGYK